MVNTLVLLTLVLQSGYLALSQVQATQIKQCPTWMYASNITGNCTCGVVDRQIVLCNNTTKKVEVLDGYIMTYNEEENTVEIGQSLYGWRRKHFIRGRKKLYYQVEQNRRLLNHKACSPFNREGRLCGKCKKGYCPLVYSYKLKCTNCSDTSINAMKFIAAAFIPLTAFYLFVVFFKFNANSPALQAYILGAQTVGAPVVCRFIITQYGNLRHFAVLSGFLGIWNLDFFRLLYSDICLNVSTMTVLSLDYAVAFYPLFLIFLTYIATRLHSRGYKVVTLAWRPFKRFLSSKWDSKSSLIDVMATFMLLSYTKILSVSFDLLDFTRPFNIHGNITGTYVYNDPTITHFGKEHLPYAIMAILFTSIFNIFPLLLLLFYPMNCFQKFLNRFKLGHVALHTFVESILGYYKDGTEPGIKDCRYFAAMFLLLRVLFYAVLGITKNVSFIIIYCSVATLFAILFVIFKPYKTQYSVYNTITVVFFLIALAVVEIFVGLSVSEIIYDQEFTLVVIACVYLFIPTLYVVALAVWWIWKHISNPMRLYYIKLKGLNQERSLTTALLFNAAERRIHTSQAYGAI